MLSPECVQRDIYKNAYGNIVYDDQKTLSIYWQGNEMVLI